ncbi:hypothetical protein [Glaciimonas sp. PAMC28666]|uniref:hypothetical protein n=1 Tax=Glaciimonas sp. PAMC28666 TaxID=2807626 RepID=UPI0019652766|nr:hypothetical protein [Glaciimonas sp. PAMC28666]QRX82156.1 hypothetical protein JQN73_18940 [Glaciimonas sp. PAMC28666]
MPKIIQTMCEAIPEEGVLIRSIYLRNNIKASALLREARRRAKSLMAHAEAEADYTFRQAKCDGYAQGILQSAGELVAYMSLQENLAVHMQSRLHESTRAILSSCVSNPDVVIAIFEEYLSRAELKESQSINLVVPEAFRSNHRTLITRLNQNYKGIINVEYHLETRFVLQVNDQVAEFAPDEFVNMASQRVLNELPALLGQSHAIKELCQERLAAIFEGTASPPTSFHEHEDDYD